MALEVVTGGNYITRTHMAEETIISWYESEQAFAEEENARRLAEAAAVLTPTLQIDAVESYPETVTQSISPTQFVTETITTYELNNQTGEVEVVVSYEVTEVMETIETGAMLWRLANPVGGR